MTIAEYRGFFVGCTYKVIDDEHTSFYKKGMGVVFVEDDGTDYPKFLYLDGNCGDLTPAPPRTLHIHLDHLVRKQILGIKITFF